jgi:hypothetical protein
MRLQNITAVAHPAGNRIDLTWTNPDPVNFPGVRVVRREGSHPVTPTDGTSVIQATGITSASDTALKGETVYYYTLFPFNGAPPTFSPDPHNRADAMATAPYDFAGLMYRLLPAVYHRYDESRGPVTNAAVSPADRLKGELRRYLDLPGSQFDQLYSLARALLNVCDLNRVEGSLLPLLGQWIGWQTDFHLEIQAQRNEIRFAPYFYQTNGLIPTVEATVKRVTGWESQTKEYVHNVARTNVPERLNLWSLLRDTAGNLGPAALASMNFVYEGRPTAVREADGSLSVFYHTYRRHGWDIWTKTFSGGQWQPSTPVVEQPGSDKHPTAAIQGGIAWLFWESCDTTQTGPNKKWRINFQTRTGGVWSKPQVFLDTNTERRCPATVADDAGGIWLFWLERTAAGGWSVKYDRNNGATWLAAPIDFPLDGGGDPRVEYDLIAIVHPTSINQKLWLFWTRHDPAAAPGQSRWTIAYRIKQTLNTAVTDWSPVRLLPKPNADVHDREPSVLLAAGGDIEIFWSSTRGGGWTLWNSVLNIGALTFSAAKQITNTAFSHRAPLALDTGAGTLLAFRSNESIVYNSSVYGATQTLDARYGGTTTADTRNVAKIALRGKFADFQSYTYEAGSLGARTNNDRIARDTIGLFLTPDIADPAQIKATVSRLANVLDQFMPISERAVFITP